MLDARYVGGRRPCQSQGSETAGHRGGCGPAAERCPARLRRGHPRRELDRLGVQRHRPGGAATRSATVRVRTRTGLKFSEPGSSRGRWKGWSLLDSVELALPAIRNAHVDAVTTAALSVVRRALVEGV